MFIQLINIINSSIDTSLKNNKVGYFYNLKEEKYFTYNNFTNKNENVPILSTVPSAPWELKETDDKYILKCENNKVLDIAWTDYIIIYSSHEGNNQQFKIDIVSTEGFDEIILRYSGGKDEVCLTSKLGRIIMDKCDENNPESGQHWLWIPQQQVEDMVFKPMKEMLDN